MEMKMKMEVGDVSCPSYFPMVPYCMEFFANQNYFGNVKFLTFVLHMAEYAMEGILKK